MMGELATVCHHLQYTVETVELKTCALCRQEKPLTREFWTPRPQRPIGWYGRCKVCRGNASKAWAKANPERVRARDRARYVPHRRTLLERIMAKVEKDAASGCWNWKGKKRRDGYGVIWSGGKASEGREVRVHRAVYELLAAPIPTGLVLDHLCRNPACCNPDHLEPVTFRENIERGLPGHTLTPADREKAWRTSVEVRRRRRGAA